MEPNPNPKPLMYQENPFNHSLKNPEQTQILSQRKKPKVMTASDIEHKTERKFSPASSSGFSDSKGHMRKSELNLSGPKRTKSI
jgi:hypothetical protein